MEQLKETKEQRFKRLTEQRVNAILDKLRVLGQLSNRSNYDYTEEQVDAAFKAIQREINAARAKFRIDGKHQKRFTW